MPDSSAILVTSLARFTGGAPWRLSLTHDRDCHLLIWITRGQARLLLDGARRGCGTHNAIHVPPRNIFALEPGRQTIGHVVAIPDGSRVLLPQTPRHLRLRDSRAIAEFTGLIEAAGREAQEARPLVAEALDAHAMLMSVWWRRQIANPEHLPPEADASVRLCRRFCALLAARFRSGETMTDYAEHLGVTPTHLGRACKVATGRTAADLLTERVLHAARDALETTDAAMQDIARHLGFGSAAYFTRFIQSHTGQTPSALRKAARLASPPAITTDVANRSFMAQTDR